VEGERRGIEVEPLEMEEEPLEMEESAEDHEGAEHHAGSNCHTHLLNHVLASLNGTMVHAEESSLFVSEHSHIPRDDHHDKPLWEHDRHGCRGYHENHGCRDGWVVTAHHVSHSHLLHMAHLSYHDQDGTLQLGLC
jgi:hypothetical protein